MIDEYIKQLRADEKLKRIQAVQALVEIGEPAVESLIATLEDDKLRVRAGAAIALGEIGDPQAIEPLIDAFKARRIFADEATEALAQFGTLAIKYLLDLLETSDSLLRKQAVVTLGKIGNPQAVHHLITLLDSSQPDVRLAAVEALGQSGDERTVGHLVKLLESRDKHLRIKSIATLADIKDERAVEPLSSLLLDSDDDERSAIITALRKIGSEKAISVLLKLLETEHDLQVLMSLLTALIDLKAVDPRITDTLLKLLDNEKRSVRLKAADLLRNSDDPYAEQILVADARQIEQDRQDFSNMAGEVELWSDPTRSTVERIHDREPLPPRSERAPTEPEKPDITSPSEKTTTGTFDPDAALGGLGMSEEEEDQWDSAHDHAPTRGIRRKRSVTVDESIQPPHFSAFHPIHVQAGKTYALMAFVHLESAFRQVQEVASGYKELMGGTPIHSSVQSRQQIDLNQLITFVPRINGLSFTPAEQVVPWQPPYKSATFAFKAPSVKTTLSGQIMVYHGPLLIGEIPVNMRWLPAEHTVHEPPTRAEFQEFDPVFASYSHRDTPVMEYFRQSRENMGVKMLVDIYDLRSGEHWADRLLEMIDESAIFQLFWSRHSAQSEYCRQEWEYALKLMDDRPRFIQPVWWETPMPAPPDELGHLHFQKIELPSVTRVQLTLTRIRRLFGGR